MTDNSAVCPTCDGELVESSSERGNYFCPDCTNPVKTRDAVFYCVECGEEEVSYSRGICSDCCDGHEQNLGLGSEPGECVWGGEEPDGLGEFAARDCPGCGTPLIPFNFGVKPLHDNEENYYVGHTCPHCDEILYRSKPASGEEMADHAKESTGLDPDPPADIDDLETVDL